MNAIHISRRLDSHVIDLPELVPLVGKRVENIVPDDEVAVESPQVTGPPPQPVSVVPPTRSAFGKGEVLYMAPDFDATPEEFAEYT